MVVAPGSTAPASPRSLSLMFFSVDGERSWIYSVGTSNGGLHQCFLALMVDALGSTALSPLRDSTVDVS
jgi:hypothetical protein